MVHCKTCMLHEIYLELELLEHCIAKIFQGITYIERTCAFYIPIHTIHFFKLLQNYEIRCIQSLHHIGVKVYNAHRVRVK